MLWLWTKAVSLAMDNEYDELLSHTAAWVYL